jgi:uncharacterized protein YciI
MSDPTSDQMNGSLLVVEAESAPAVRAVIEGDIYWANDVVSFFRLSVCLSTCLTLSLNGHTFF